MPSLRSKALSAALAATGRRRRFASAEAVRTRVAQSARRPASHLPPRSLGRVADISRTFVGAWPVYDVCPRGGEPDARVLYFHGGGFVDELERRHWAMVRALVVRARARVVVPAYALAPRGTADRTVPVAADLLSGLIESGGAGGTVLLGDSSGAGLALAGAQRLRDRTGTQPSRIVLVCPWLDVTMSHPDQAAIEAADPLSARPGLLEAGRLYAGTLPAEDPRVSPLRGTFAGLAPMTVFTGTRDVLATDGRELLRRARAAGVEAELHEGTGLPHGYPLLPVPEGRAARDRIVELVRSAANA
ncbi:alpha/beta hydrolase fold domain-containing protein [Streptomyces antarcticus]|uniref:alpha/beta hydrolase fold domain-containing protein n=1 Tax=Streptomyces antarcticus TaxID=2996458 RepID=UPI002271A794|nr:MULTISPECIES: alpha/beta hydrolase [unclassified Streptomyces]MCY0944906.1 alpha/beta hydrolase [Streptomyces sp. H34-AA3]MCZ4083331.1 alpha/beta hydrolase [Streptomyces sp. H34-S5]